MDSGEFRDTDVTSHPSAASGWKAMGLAVGAIGVVFGDIGTSPLYAFRLALQQAVRGGVTPFAIQGVVSLALWAMILVVTVKYVFFLMRADNHGEGGVLSLAALAERAAGKRTQLIFVLSLLGAALFYGDAAITPAISVLSAVEGLKAVPRLSPHMNHTAILVVSLVILLLLFAVQSRGTGKISKYFGPIMIAWFLSVAALGLSHLADGPAILAAISPTFAMSFIATHGLIGFLVLGSVFLTVTGAEALFADMGHFGRWPIQASWLFFALPCLAMNYLGQGAMALNHLTATAQAGHAFGDVDWFFEMAPPVLRVPMAALTVAATIIASQAVITGAYSLTQQAMQLGFLPRMSILNTSDKHSGQIYLPAVNAILCVAVLFLVVAFKSSAALGDAYGLAVTGTMVVTTTLGFLVVRRLWRWPLAGALALVTPLIALDLVFLAANALKIPTGGWLPLTIAAGVILLMTTWVRGTRRVTEKMRKLSVPLSDAIAMLGGRIQRVPGAAVFLTSDPETAPAALLHNLKHNHVLHETNLIVTVRTIRKPRIGNQSRITVEHINESFKRVTILYGFMERPNIPKALAKLRDLGVRCDVMSTSFFLGRRTMVAASSAKQFVFLRRLYITLAKNSSDPTTYFSIPPGRVVELGSQVAI